MPSLRAASSARSTGPVPGEPMEVHPVAQGFKRGPASLGDQAARRPRRARRHGPRLAS